MRTAGVRFPAHLLPAVHSMLDAARLAAEDAARAGALPQSTSSDPAADPAGSPQLGRQALRAAAMGAGGAVRVEPVAPVHKRSQARMLRCGPMIFKGACVSRT